jgi:endonuclease/exonuclease/phosphatase family metal-dependent hydrolase
MRIATYNLNNLFERPKVLELDGFSSEAKPILKAYYWLVNTVEKETYSESYKTQMLDYIKLYVEPKKRTEKYITINQVKGKLYSTYQGKLSIKASGRADWLGWIDLVKNEVNEVATQNTARVVQEVNADILCCVEVENRLALQNFNKYLLGEKYHYSMLIDGNDERGIDVGIYSQHVIVNIASHIFDTYIDDRGVKQEVFSRDCPVYSIKYNNQLIHIFCNHFKSQGYGSKEGNDKKRKRQAERVKEIIQERGFNLQTDFVVIAGDLNDSPENDPLQPLLAMPHLVNSVTLLGLENTGTYQGSKKQLDYLLISKALADRYIQGGIEKRGIYSVRGNKFDTVTSEINQASDHAAVWAEFNI